MIDCLAHLEDPRVEEVEALLLRAKSAGVVGIINGGVEPGADQLPDVGSDPSLPRIWRSFGVHPVAAGRRGLKEQLELLERALGAGEPVAIGEIGLDGREGFPPLELQERLLEAQLEVARSRDLPVILHCVQATGLLLDLLARCGLPAAGGMMHGFTGSLESAEEFLRLGLHISFGGMVTRPGAKRCRVAAVGVPGHRLLVESDCPDHAPSGTSGSEPAGIAVTILELAGLRGESPEDLAAGTEANARGLFGGLL